MDHSPWFYLALLASGFAGGWVDSIAGGGGLITIPVLLGLGLPPQAALGTNKLQASFGSFTATFHYYRKGVVDLRDARPGVAMTLAGGVAGTWAVQQIDPGFLNLLIPVLLLAIAVYMMVAPRLTDADSAARVSRAVFYPVIGFTLGFYDGFFGPGAGSFGAFAFVAGLGFNLTKATGYTKLMNFTSNVVALAVFALYGNVVVLPALVMAGGQVLGARVGSGLVVRNGARFIRPIFISVILLTAAKLLYDQLAR
jgi:uncharacterized membrane protein YfcA